MICRPLRLSSRSLLLLAGFVAFFSPAAVRAEYVIFRNECGMSVVVQTATVVRGVLKRDQALIRPGEYTAKIPLNSDKVITIYDGRTGRVLFREPLRASKKPLGYGIVRDRNPAKVQVTPRALPAQMPIMPRRR